MRRYPAGRDNPGGVGAFAGYAQTCGQPRAGQRPWEDPTRLGQREVRLDKQDQALGRKAVEVPTEGRKGNGASFDLGQGQQGLGMPRRLTTISQAAGMEWVESPALPNSGVFNKGLLHPSQPLKPFSGRREKPPERQENRAGKENG